MPQFPTIYVPDSTPGSGGVPDDGSVTNVKVAADAAIAKSKLAALNIVNADVDASAAIAKSKLASLNISDSDITAGGLTNSAISASAAIAKTKLASLNVGDADITAGGLTNSAISASAAIAKSKLASLNIADADIVGTGLTNAAISSSAAIAKSKLAALSIGDSDISGSGLTNSAIASAAGIVSTKLSSAVQTSLGLADGSVQKTLFTTAGDIATSTGSGIWGRRGIGSNGKPLRVNTANSDKLEYTAIILPANTFANIPAANSVLPDTVFPCTDRAEMYVSDGSNWTVMFQFGLSDRALDTGELVTPVNFTSGAVGLNDQTLKLTYFTAVKTETIATVFYTVGNTAAGATPTLSRFGIWEASADGALTSLVASTANDTALFTGTTSQTRTKALSSSFGKVRGKRYAVGALVVTSQTAPQVAGGTYQSISGVSSVAGTRIAGQVASQSDLPSTLAAGSIANTTSAPFFALVQ